MTPARLTPHALRLTSARLHDRRARGRGRDDRDPDGDGRSPSPKYTLKRQDEIELRYQLRLMTGAIDKYKQVLRSGVDPDRAWARRVTRRN